MKSGKGKREVKTMAPTKRARTTDEIVLSKEDIIISDRPLPEFVRSLETLKDLNKLKQVMWDMYAFGQKFRTREWKGSIDGKAPVFAQVCASLVLFLSHVIGLVTSSGFK